MAGPATEQEPEGAFPRLELLGPLRIRRGEIELEAGPAQQAQLLALLAARSGRPISTVELIDLIWGPVAPRTAANTVHRYIGTLRRILEPQLPLRHSGSYLLRQGNGYVCVAGPGVLDLAEFRLKVVAARAASANHIDKALDLYLDALGLWRGSAAEGVTFEATATAILAGLDAEFFDACVAAADLALFLGESERVLPVLLHGAQLAPLHEPLQASLIRALSAVGLRENALAVFEETRSRLADELGIEPGRHLNEARLKITVPGSLPVASRPQSSLVGRHDEYEQLWSAVEGAIRGRSGLVFLEGEPGVGKSRLIEEIGAEALRRDALVVWGKCLEGDGVPTMWPWMQIVRSLLSIIEPARQRTWNESGIGVLIDPRHAEYDLAIPVAGSQFRMFEDLVALVIEASRERSIVLVVDDLQWADVASLRMLSHLAAQLPGSLAVLCALRNRAPAPNVELARTLARASRVPECRRLQLATLSENDVGELIRRETGHLLGARALQAIHYRTAGNPFFVREIARLLVDDTRVTDDTIAQVGIPASVLDVVRDRLEHLDQDTVRLVHTAALMGREIDLSLLAHATRADEQTCLNRLEPLVGLGLLGRIPGTSHSLRFTHDLVRESVAELTPRSSLPQMHLHVANALALADPHDDSLVELLAHHLLAAEPLAEPRRTVIALIRAGRWAANKSALEAADVQLEMAARVARSAGLPDLELSALTFLMTVRGMLTGYVGSAFDLLQRAEELARILGREREAAGLLFSRWAAYSQGSQIDPAGTRSDALARRLLEQGERSSDVIVCAYGLNAWGTNQWEHGNIGEAFRYFERASLLDLNAEAGSREPLRRDLQLLWPALHALVAALHGDLAKAHALLDESEFSAGEDPFALTIWAAFSVLTAALAGDPAWALRAAERGLAADPDTSYAFFGSYHRLGRCWAMAMTGDAAHAASEARAIINADLLDPPRSGLTAWLALLAEMYMATGDPTGAEASLDQAESLLDVNGQRYPAGLVLLLRARILADNGDTMGAVDAAESARSSSLIHECNLFARRADGLLTELAPPR